VGYASHGGLCPLCGNYASRTATGKQYRHRGAGRLNGRELECYASGVMFEVARQMRANKDAGRHPHRNEDGSWIYVCARCGRQAIPQPVRCESKTAAHCVRPPLQLPVRKLENDG
jgi:hypothetical protein